MAPTGPGQGTIGGSLAMTRSRTRRSTALLLSAALVSLVWSVFPVPCHSGNAGVGWDNSIAEKKGKARTVAELSAMWDSRHCGECHVQQQREWQQSAHSESVMGSRRLGRKALAILQIFDVARDKWPYAGLKDPSDVKVEHLAACTRCHLPQLSDAEDSVARELVADFLKWRDATRNKDAKAAREVEVKLSGLAVNCLICHNRNAIVHKWTDGYPAKGVVYGSKDGRHACGQFPSMKKSPVMGEPVLCGQCHGAGPLLDRDNPSQCPTAYGYYLFEYQAVGGDETCQECHMRKSKLGHNIQSYRHPAMVDAGLAFTADISRVLQFERETPNPGPIYAPRIAVTVSMTNKSGHSIPDGCPTVARLVLDVSAKASDGSEIFFDEKIYMPIAQTNGRGNLMGKGPFEKTSMIVDTSLRPLTTVKERYEISVPKELYDGSVKTEGARKKEVEVSVKLVYLPYGTMNPSDTPFTWHEVVKKVPLTEVD